MIRFRRIATYMVSKNYFDSTVLLFIGLNCITLAMERPNIPPDSTERAFLAACNNVFTVVFGLEMLIKVKQNVLTRKQPYTGACLSIDIQENPDLREVELAQV